MLADYVFEEGSFDHVKDMFHRIRKADCEEIAATSGESPNAALYRSFRTSLYSWAMVNKATGRTVTLGGAAAKSILGETGSVWLLATEEIHEPDAGLILAANTHKYLDKLMNLFTRLENHADERNEKTIRWLRWAGFRVEPAAPWGIEGRYFHYFWMERDE